MSDLIEFLRARLDEDEWDAVACDGRAWRVRIPEPKRYPQTVFAAGTSALICQTFDGPVDNTGLERLPSSALHITRHHPKRVLADVAAKRAIVDLWEDPDSVRMLPDGVHDGRDANEVEAEYAAACEIDDVVRHLAAVYADHPDYRSEWKP